jgi:hypothetical protein
MQNRFLNALLSDLTANDTQRRICCRIAECALPGREWPGIPYSWNTHDRTLDSAFADRAVHAGVLEDCRGVIPFRLGLPVRWTCFRGQAAWVFQRWRFLLVGLRWWLKKVVVPSGKQHLLQSERMTKTKSS